MAEYHVGCGITGIYAGRINKKKDMWLEKSDVTDEACSAVAQFLMDKDESMLFEYEGKKYILTVQEVKE